MSEKIGKGEKITVYLISLILFLTLTGISVRFIELGDPISLLWICYLAILVIIIGLLKKNSSLVLSQVIILAIPDLFWIVDFVSLVFFGHSIFGLASYFSSESLLGKLTSLQHLYTVPLSLWALAILKTRKNPKIILASFAEVSVMFVLTLLFVPSFRDINCVHVSCVNLSLGFPVYYLAWFAFVFSSIVLSYFALSLFPLFWKSRKAV